MIKKDYNPKNYEEVSLDQIKGGHFTEVFVSNNQYDVDSLVPDKHHLTNFDLVAQEGSWLVLDNYGNEELSTNIEKRLLGTNPYTIAINRKTGQIYSVVFCVNKAAPEQTFAAFLGFLAANFHEKHLVPAEYLVRLDELKSHKRPFNLTFEGKTLLSFIDREIGYNELSSDLIVHLDFRPMSLEITAGMYREVSWAWTRSE